jgi:hypothetical protein
MQIFAAFLQDLRRQGPATGISSVAKLPHSRYGNTSSASMLISPRMSGARRARNPSRRRPFSPLSEPAPI